MTSLLRHDTSLSDDQLIRDALGGRREAFGELVKKHQGRVMNLALRMVRNREEAEDIIQQVFIEAYRHLADFHYGSQFSTWLYAIALNRARNHLRSRKSRRMVAMDGADSDGNGFAPLQFADTTPPPDEIIEKQFNLEWIQKEVLSLSDDYQLIFSLHYFQDVLLHEIANRLGRPLGTIKVYLHRARNELYSRWAQQMGHALTDG